MARNVRTRQTLLLIVLSPLLLVVLVLLVLALPFLLAYRFLLRLVFEVLVAAKGRRILFVYSRSPVWQDYVERNWLPRLADHAMVLNWSDRASWKGRWSFAVWVFRHWALATTSIQWRLYFRRSVQPSGSAATMRFAIGSTATNKLYRMLRSNYLHI